MLPTVNPTSVWTSTTKPEANVNLIFFQTFEHLLIFFFNNFLGPQHGRKRRAIDHDKNVTEYTKFKENLQYTVLMPGELTRELKYTESADQCRNFVMISGLLAGLLALSTIIVS